jgi:hypothetical protein
MKPGRDRKNDSKHHWDGGCKATGMEPRIGVPLDGSRPIQEVLPGVLTSLSASELDTAQHVVKEYED